jgi:hypothetical protein
VVRLALSNWGAQVRGFHLNGMAAHRHRALCRVGNVARFYTRIENFETASHLSSLTYEACTDSQRNLTNKTFAQCH